MLPTPAKPQHRAPRTRRGAWVAWLISACLAIGLPAAANSDLDLPSIGEPADRALSPSEEKEIGARIVAQILRQGVILEDPEITAYVRSVGNRLGAYSASRPVTGLYFFVVRDPTINAFALPGGYIGLNTGLITTSRNESELAGVIGHEIAHVTQRHIARQLQGGEGWNLATAALVIAAIVAGAADPDVIQAALGIGLGSLQQRQISHIRAHELEADRIGIRTLAAAGYNPEGMATFFERMQQTSRLYGSQLPEILRTHPVNSTRIAEARTRLAGMEGTDRESSLEYELMKARSRVLSSEPVSAASEFFQRSVDADPDDPAARYGQALISLLSGDGERALQSIEPALRAHPNQPNIQLLAAQAQHVAGNQVAARERFEQVLLEHPQYPPAALSYGEVLLRMGKPQRAREVLITSPAFQQGDSQAYRLLALAARDSQREGEAHYQMAAHFQARGDYRNAINQLHAGLRRKDLSEDERIRLQSRLEAYRGELSKWFREDRQPAG